MCSMNIFIHILLDAHVNASWTESGECEQERQTILDYESQAEQVGLTHAYTKKPHTFLSIVYKILKWTIGHSVITFLQ